MEREKSDVHFETIFQGNKGVLLDLGQTQKITGGIALNVYEEFYCQTVTISFNRGIDKSDLFSADGNVTLKSETEGWTPVNTSQADKGNGIQEFTLEYADPGGSSLLEPLCFWIEGEINNQAGLPKVQITITYTDETGEKSYSEKKKFYFRKEAGEPFIRNFTANRIGEERTPCMVFKQKEEINFSWESYGGIYKLYRGNDEEPLYSGTDCRFTFKEELMSGQVFILKGTWGNNQKDGKEQLGSGEQVVYKVLSIQVENPSIVCNELLVNKSFTAKDAIFSVRRGHINLLQHVPKEGIKVRFKTDGIAYGWLGLAKGGFCTMYGSIYENNPQQFLCFSAQSVNDDILSSDGKAHRLILPGELTIPVAKGQTLKIYVTEEAGPSIEAEVYWFFISTGDTPGGELPFEFV